MPLAFVDVWRQTNFQIIITKEKDKKRKGVSEQRSVEMLRVNRINP